MGLLALAYPAPVATPAQPTASDVVAFESIVARLRGGAGYYAAFGDDVRARGYPTRSVFNWRTPLHLSAVAATTDAVARGVLLILLAALVGATVTASAGAAPAVRIAAVAAQAGIVVLYAAPAMVFLAEAWAGVLVGLSACALMAGWVPAGVGLATLALFARELAAPYCVACVLVAARTRDWGQLRWWAAAAATYAVYFATHVAQVSAHRLPGDFAHASGWWSLGGVPFLLATLHWSGWPFMVPPPWAALTLVLVIGAVCASKAPTNVRAASLAFVVFFLAAGQPFNHYWGLTAGPVWALASGYGAGLVIQSVQALRGPAADAPSTDTV